MTEYGMGWRPSPPDVRDWKPEILRALVTLGVARPVAWTIPKTVDLYQGKKPFCVAYSGGYFISAEGSQAPIVEGVDNAYCDQLYTDIKAIEGVLPGDPDFMEGACLRSLGKALRNRGVIDAYSLTQDFVAADNWVDTWGCVDLGVFWWTGMFHPDDVGRIRPTGVREGGHAILWRAKDQTYGNCLRNSWGKTWGADGECFVSDLDMNGLLQDQGEALLMVKLAANYRPPIKKASLCHFGKAMRKKVKV